MAYLVRDVDLRRPGCRSPPERVQAKAIQQSGGDLVAASNGVAEVGDRRVDEEGVLYSRTYKKYKTKYIRILLMKSCA